MISKRSTEKDLFKIFFCLKLKMSMMMMMMMMSMVVMVVSMKMMSMMVNGMMMMGSWITIRISFDSTNRTISMTIDHISAWHSKTTAHRDLTMCVISRNF